MSKKGKAQQRGTFAEYVAQLQSRADSEPVPRSYSPKRDRDKTPRLPPHAERDRDKVIKEQSPRAPQGGSRLSKPVKWCETKADKEGEWTWGPRAWSDADWNDEIHPNLREFEQLTWEEVRLQTVPGRKGVRHMRHHEQEVATLCREAQERWMELDLEQYETAFRFRTGSRKRLWGFIIGAHFHFVWWDPHHKIYPTEPH